MYITALLFTYNNTWYKIGVQTTSAMLHSLRIEITFFKLKHKSDLQKCRVIEKTKLDTKTGNQAVKNEIISLQSWDISVNYFRGRLWSDSARPSPAKTFYLRRDLLKMCFSKFAQSNILQILCFRKFIANLLQFVVFQNF